MSDRVIEIIVDVADKTGGKLNGLKEQLLAMDRAVQRMHDKMKNFADRKYAATLRLIDRVSEPGGKINSLLKRLAGKVHSITLRINDAALGKIRELEAKLMRLAGKAWTIAVNVKDNIKGKLGGLMDGLAMGAGVFAPIAGAAGIGYGVANGLQAYMDFQQQMSRVQAVANLSKTDPMMIQLTEKAKEMGATTEWTRSEAAQAMYYQAMAGWSPEKILAATPSIMHLASAGGTDLATTSDILTDTMTGFRINAGDKFKDAFGREVEVSQHYADMMATLVTSSNTNISQLGEALKYSANVVGAMYNDKPLETRMHAAEDAMVMTGLMANAGIKGSMAGTSTRAVFSRFGAENRNAYNALRALGVEFTDKDTGEVRRIRDVMKDLHTKFTEGVDPNQLLEFAEAISGEKIHADTRRKLNSFIESTQKNGGKMTGADMLKMSSMLAGQEAMSGFLAAILGDWDELATKIENAHGAAERMADVQLDNLSGDIKKLGSAWDAFQQSFFEGQAGEGLRNFTQALTDMVTNANKLFSDGIQIGDIVSVIGDAIGRLRDKFLQFDGIGSLLAGGALMAGLLKIGSTIQKIIGYFKQLRAADIGTRLGGGNPPPGKPPPGLAGNVGTMNVKAGVVNIAGKVNGGAGAGSGTGGAGGAGGGGAGGRRVGDRTIIDRYNRERERIRGAGGAGGAGGGGGSPPTSRFAGMKSAAKGGAAFAAIFGALDYFSTRSMSADRLAEANEELALAQREYKEQLSQGATQDVLADYTKRIEEAQQNQLAVMKANRAAEAESLGGATGAVVGTALGAAIGSLIGPIGTMVGGIIGGMAGDYLGTKLAQVGVEREENLTSTAKADVSPDVIAAKVPGAKELKAIEERENPKDAFDEITMTTKKKLMPWWTDRDANYFGYNGEDLLKYADDWWGGKKKQPSWSEFRMTDAGLTPPNLSKASETLEQWQARIEAETAEFAAAHKPKPKDFSGTSFFDTPISQPYSSYGEGQAALKKYTTSGKQATTATSSLTDKLKEFAPSMEGIMGTIAAAFPALMGMFPDTLDKLLFNRSEAAEVTDAQRLTEGQVPTEMPKPPEVKPEESMNLGEWFNFDGVSEKLSEFGEMISEGFSSAFESAGETLSEFGEIISEGFSSALEGVGETLSEFGEMISEGFSSAFEGVGETLSEFGEMISEGFSTAFEGVEEIFGELGEIISEGLSSALEGAGEIFSEFGEMISEGLTVASEMASEIISTLGETISEGITTALTTAGEMFASFGELVSSGLAAAQGAAESALSAIGAAFDSTKAMIMGAWSELPGFFSGIFSTLGGVAAAAGSAIYSGLTSVIGAVIGAWQSAAATVSSIIASISAAASSVASMIPSFGGGGGGAFAEGGFVTSPTQALVGEAGAEVIIPLSASKRSRALELFEKTAGILGGDALNVGGDQFQSELDNELADEAPYSANTSEGLDADKPVAKSEGESKSSGVTVNLGGMQVTFNIDSASNPQEIMHTIRENLADVADRVGAWLAKSIDNINQNQPLEA